MNLNTTLLDKKYYHHYRKNCCGVTRGVLPLPEARPGAEPDCKVPGNFQRLPGVSPSPPSRRTGLPLQVQGFRVRVLVFGVDI